MKPSIYFILLGLICFAKLKAEHAVLTGNIANCKVKLVKASYNGSLVAYKQVEQTAVIDKRGNYRMVFELKGLKEIYIIIDEQQTSLYLQPGDSVFLENDYKSFDSSIVFSGKGADKNSFYRDFKTKMIFGHEQDIFIANARKTPGVFAAFCDSILNQKIKFLETHAGKMSPDFKEQFLTGLIYENGNSKLAYPGLWAYLNQKHDTLPDMPAGYYKFMKDLPVSNSRLLANPEFLDYTRSVFSYFRSQHSLLRKDNPDYQQCKSLAKLLFQNDDVVSAHMAAYVMSMLQNNKFKDSEPMYVAFVKDYPGSLYDAELRELYAKIKRIAPGQPAPEFTLTDINGKQRSLNEFKGRVVYLDFWASWCGPCLMEMPASKKLEQQFHQADIVFLYVSIDEDAQSWKDMVKKKEIQGVHLNAPDFNHTISKAYNVTGVPSYFLIGRDGKVIDNAAPRPSNKKDIEQAINTALVEQH